MWVLLSLHLLCGAWCLNRRKETLERWKHKKDLGETIQKGVSDYSSCPFQSLSLCSCSWEWSAAALKHTGVLNIKQPDHMDTSQILPHHYITQKVKKVYCPSSLRPLSLPSMFPKKGWWKRLAVPKIFLIQKIQKRAWTQTIPTWYFCLLWAGK